MPSAEDILSMNGDEVAVFIHDNVEAKTLSTLMQDLNEALISGDAAASWMAARALQHLGFPEYA